MSNNRLRLGHIKTKDGQVKDLMDVHDWWNYGINTLTGWKESNFKVYHPKRKGTMQSVNLHAIKRDIKAMPK